MFKEATAKKPQAILEPGNELLDALKQIRGTTKRSEKEQIIKALAETDLSKEFFEGVKLANQSSITFGVKQVPEKMDEQVGEVLDPTQAWQKFVELAQRLNLRLATGNEAKAEIQDLMNKTDKERWNSWFRPILMKDLKAGFSETTTNPILKALNRTAEMTEVYSCALAEHIDTLWEPSETGELIPTQRLGSSTVYADVKLNGARINAFVDPFNQFQPIILRTREGRLSENFKSIEESLLKLIPFIRERFKTAVVFDGEVMSASFQKLMTQLNRKSDVQTSDCTLYIFDFLPVQDFLAGVSEKPYKARILDRLDIQAELERIQINNIKNLTAHLFDINTVEGCQSLEEFRRKALDNSFEGLVIKMPESLYRTKRTFDWLAYKPTLTVDLAVTGFEEGEKGTKNEGSLGALVVEGEYQGKQIKVKVGSGFKPDQETRKKLWDTQSDVLGMVAEIRADEITKPMEGDHWSLRFPRFVKWRGFKPGEKV